MWSISGGLGGGGVVKALVFLILFLLIAAFVVGVIFSNSYWGNPPREQAEAERMQIENRVLEARQQIEVEALRERTEIETEVHRRAAERALMWKDRWNEIGIVLAIVAVMGTLTVASICLAGPVALRIYERRTQFRAQLLEDQIALAKMVMEREAKQAERLREARLIEQARRQWPRPERERLEGNGKGS
jgi:hypothetical protein